MFQKGNKFGVGQGRPRGAKTKLTAKIYEDVFRLWNEPAADGSKMTRGEEVLLTLYREKPLEFVRAVFSILPRDLIIENAAVAELDDDELDRMIEMLRERALAARQEQPQLVELKVVPT